MKLVKKILLLSIVSSLSLHQLTWAQVQDGGSLDGSGTTTPEGGQTINDGTGGDPFAGVTGGGIIGGNNTGGNNDNTDYGLTAASASAVLCGDGEVISQGDSKADYVNNACEGRGGVLAYVSDGGSLNLPQNPNAVTLGNLGVSGAGASAAGSNDIDLTLSGLPSITDLPDYGDIALIYNPITLPDFDPGPIGTGGTGT